MANKESLFKKELIKAGYRRYKQPNNEPTLYQKKVLDKKGIKYFINCYHYFFPKEIAIRESWEFKFQLEIYLGIVNTTLFNIDKKTISQIEEFIESTWVYYGRNYYDEWEKNEEKQNGN